ncbi:hypothetical protein BFJ70_g15499 [Fusarium oxysporum]|nr:hypothetical protein BFJ66_g5596 [Fusarium oxysporum f. sp. cepae]RKL15113.1 hypothetical protein BFJ70_g15499 [Fusarium oxysporum]
MLFAPTSAYNLQDRPMTPGSPRCIVHSFKYRLSKAELQA